MNRGQLLRGPAFVERKRASEIDREMVVEEEEGYQVGRRDSKLQCSGSAET